ncbi:MAG: hydrogenase maturation protease [Thermaerobacter sp.]|nr:hydrogenase maturation protease [Thermaerobacter sp.]
MLSDPMICIIGCGNLLRGDDAAGPRLVRRMWDAGVPPHVRLVDGGTAGMDVAFQMDGASEVVLVDACRTGAAPGTLYEVPGEEVEIPPLTGANLHAFRWDQALAFARWLLKDRFPRKVTVFLVEAGQVEPGLDLSPSVAATLERLVGILRQRYQPAMPTPHES